MKKLRIIDLSTLIPGPFASFLLEKYLDAQIIKFEDEKAGDLLSNLRPTKEGIGLSYLAINGNKKVRQVDLSGAGREEILKEIKEADIFLHNYRETKAEKLGLSFMELKKINPNLLYYSITGYPKSHPLFGKAAHDLNILAISGYLDMANKLNGNLSPPPMQLADIFTSYHLNLRIMSSLIKGEKGKEVQVSMFEAIVEAMTIYQQPNLQIKKEINADDALMNGQFPCYAIYQTRESGYVAVAALEKPIWIDFISHIGREDLADKQFDKTIIKELGKEMQKKNKKDWHNNDFCVTPVLSFLEAKKEKYV